MIIIVLILMGFILSSLFTIIGYRLPKKINIFINPFCDTCNHELKISECIPIFSYILNKGKCKYCNQKISFLYLFTELITCLLFPLTYIVFGKMDNSLLYILLGIIFISTLIIIIFTDSKYMIIPNELLIASSILVIILKVYLQYKNEEITSLLDAGYSVLFMLLDAFVMFLIMYIIKMLGDLVFKKESLGGGDVKMMSFVALLLGYKISIIVIFIASFLALPISIYNAYKKNEAMLPFGPYLAISSIILFLLNINFDEILEILK